MVPVAIGARAPLWMQRCIIGGKTDKLEKHLKMPQQENPDKQETSELVVMTSDGTELTPQQIAELRVPIRESGGIDPFDRRLRLGEEYRTSLYTRLCKAHPQVFADDADPMRRHENAALIMDFLRRTLQDDEIQVNEKVFGMLYLDFISSREFHLIASALRKGLGS